MLTEVFLGAELLTELTFKKVHTEEFEDKSASGIASLVMGPLSAAVKAGLSALSSGQNEETLTIKTETNFQPTPEDPKTVIQMLELIEKIPDLLTKPFPDLSEEIAGWPIRYFLVPIQQFLDFDAILPVEPTFQILDIHFLEAFTLIISTIKDFCQYEFLRHYICQKDFR